jgi:hypothetical protein
LQCERVETRQRVNLVPRAARAQRIRIIWRANQFHSDQRGLGSGKKARSDYLLQAAKAKWFPA